MSGRRFISAFAFLPWCSVALAAPPVEPSPAPPAERIVITAQSLVFKNQENTALFEGKVVMTKVNFIMHADQMLIYFDGGVPSASPKASGKGPGPPRSGGPELPAFGNRAVSLIEAMGHVVMEQGGKRAKSKKAVYSQRDEKLVLTGDPEVWEEGYLITGVRMTMYLKEDRSVVEGSRVLINETESDSR